MKKNKEKRFSELTETTIEELAIAMREFELKSFAAPRAFITSGQNKKALMDLFASMSTHPIQLIRGIGLEFMGVPIYEPKDIVFI